MLVRLQDAAERAGNQKDRHREDTSTWTTALCLVGALHVCVEVPRAVWKEKAA